MNHCKECLKKSKAAKQKEKAKATALKNKTATKDKKACFGWGVEPNLIFHTYARVIEQSFLRRVYKKLVKTAGLHYIKLHGLRHAFASILLSEGANLFYVSKQLGHRSINITSNVYGHFIPTMGNRAVDLLDFAAPKMHLSLQKVYK